jgi:uncharacterized membrane protein
MVAENPTEIKEPVADPTESPEQLESLETWISWLLRLGVMLSGLILVTGLALELWAGSPDLPRGPAVPFSDAPVPLPPDVSPLRPLAGLGHGQPAAVIQLGLLILILTPMLRVVAALVLFVLQGDRVYMVVSLVVLITLLSSFHWNLHEGGRRPAAPAQQSQKS